MNFRIFICLKIGEAAGIVVGSWYIVHGIYNQNGSFIGAGVFIAICGFVLAWIEGKVYENIRS